SEEHTSELQSRFDLVCRLLLEKKNEVFELAPHQRQGDAAALFDHFPVALRFAALARQAPHLRLGLADQVLEPGEIRRRLLATAVSQIREAASTFTVRRAGEPWKMTASILPPLSKRGHCSPRTQRTLSEMLDLPQPFGPSIFFFY